MAFVVCLIGAVLGVAVAIVCGRFALPIALRGQQRSTMIDRMPLGLNDRGRLETLTRQVYRYAVPAIFGVVGAIGAYTIWIGPIGK